MRRAIGDRQKIDDCVCLELSGGGMYVGLSVNGRMGLAYCLGSKKKGPSEEEGEK